MARRAQVTQIMSNYGTNLVGSERELREAVQSWNNAQIHDFPMQKDIDWSFSPFGGSHYGGIFAGQIRSILAKSKF